MTMQAPSPSAGAHVFDRILDLDAALVGMETADPETLLEQCRDRARRSGQAVYVWREGEGLCSLRETGVRIPGCLRLGDTLRYVLKSRHFGIYLMVGMSARMAHADLSLLRRVARTQTSFVRRVVLLTEGPELAERVGEPAVSLKHEQAMQACLRLRGGRWIH